MTLVVFSDLRDFPNSFLDSGNVETPAHMNIVRTIRLDLIPAPTEFIELLIARDYERAGGLLNIVVPVGWPNDAEARMGLSYHLQAMRKDSAEFLWRIRLIVLRSNRNVIGSINLKGPPEDSGTVEIGWGISPAYRRQGMATEAAEAVIEWANSQPKVRRIIATIPADNIASIGVAQRLGMEPTGESRRNLPVWELNLRTTR